MNPYSKTILDECSGTEVPNQRYQDFQAGIKEVVEWIRKHQLVQPDNNSITQFYPFYQIEERELKEWGCKLT